MLMGVVHDGKDSARGTVQLRWVGRMSYHLIRSCLAYASSRRRGFFDGALTISRKNGVAMFRIGFLVLIVACAVLFFTNPSHDAHKQVVYADAVTQATQSEVLGKIAVDLLGKSEIVPLAYNNYYVCSTTTLKGETKSVGAFSRVWKWK